MVFSQYISMHLMELGQLHVTNEKTDPKVSIPLEDIGILKSMFPMHRQMTVINKIRHQEIDHLTRIQAFDHLCDQRHSHLLIRVAGLKVFVRPFLLCPSPVTHTKTDAACKVTMAISAVSPQPASLNYLINLHGRISSCPGFSYKTDPPVRSWRVFFITGLNGLRS